MKRGVTRYRAVDLGTGELLFEQNIGNQTINIGEFLGVVEAAKYIIEHRFSPAIIYTDSLTALTWFNEQPRAKETPHSKKRKSFSKRWPPKSTKSKCSTGTIPCGARRPLISARNNNSTPRLMARLKKDLHKYVEIREEDYLQLVENTMIVEAMKLAGVEKLPLWKAVRRILDDRRIEIHVKPVNRRYAD